LLTHYNIFGNFQPNESYLSPFPHSLIGECYLSEERVGRDDFLTVRVGLTFVLCFMLSIALLVAYFIEETGDDLTMNSIYILSSILLVVLTLVGAIVSFKVQMMKARILLYISAVFSLIVSLLFAFWSFNTGFLLALAIFVLLLGRIIRHHITSSLGTQPEK